MAKATNCAGRLLRLRSTLAQRIRLDGATPHHQREQLNKVLKSDGRIQIRGYVEEHGIELFRLAKESAQRDLESTFRQWPLRSGLLLHHPRLLSGLPFAGSLCSG
jgi:hypothetical protein